MKNKNTKTLAREGGLMEGRGGTRKGFRGGGWGGQVKKESASCENGNALAAAVGKQRSGPCRG